MIGSLLFFWHLQAEYKLTLRPVFNAIVAMAYCWCYQDISLLKVTELVLGTLWLG